MFTRVVYKILLIINYFTKYDCSSGDLNVIGSICKNDLKSFLKWAGEILDINIANEICD